MLNNSVKNILKYHNIGYENYRSLKSYTERIGNKSASSNIDIEKLKEYTLRFRGKNDRQIENSSEKHLPQHIRSKINNVLKEFSEKTFSIENSKNSYELVYQNNIDINKLIDLYDKIGYKVFQYRSDGFAQTQRIKDNNHGLLKPLKSAEVIKKNIEKSIFFALKENDSNKLVSIADIKLIGDGMIEAKYHKIIKKIKWNTDEYKFYEDKKNEPHIGFFDGIGVLPSHRRKGIAMLTENIAKEIMLKLDIRRAFGKILVVPCFNSASLNLHKKLDWRIIGSYEENSPQYNKLHWIVVEWLLDKF